MSLKKSSSAAVDAEKAKKDKEEKSARDAEKLLAKNVEKFASKVGGWQKKEILTKYQDAQTTPEIKKAIEDIAKQGLEWFKSKEYIQAQRNFGLGIAVAAGGAVILAGTIGIAAVSFGIGIPFIILGGVPAAIAGAAVAVTKYQLLLDKDASYGAAALENIETAMEKWKKNQAASVEQSQAKVIPIVLQAKAQAVQPVIQQTQARLTLTTPATTHSSQAKPTLQQKSSPATTTSPIKSPTQTQRPANPGVSAQSQTTQQKSLFSAPQASQAQSTSATPHTKHLVTSRGLESSWDHHVRTSKQPDQPMVRILPPIGNITHLPAKDYDVAVPKQSAQYTGKPSSPSNSLPRYATTPEPEVKNLASQLKSNSSHGAPARPTAVQRLNSQKQSSGINQVRR